MNRTPRLGAVLGLVLASTALAADKLEKLAAPALVAQAIGNTQKQQGYHTTLAIEVMQQPVSLDGVVRGDLLHTTGAVEAFARGKATLVKKSDGTWVTPDKAEGREGQMAAAIEHPNLLLALILKASKSAKFDGESTEEINGVACRKITCSADKEAKKAGVEALIDMRRNAGNLGGMFNASLFDLERTSLTYTIYASTADGLVYQVKSDLDAAIDKNKSRAGAAAMMPGGLSLKRTIDFKQYNGELEFEVPPEVKAKLGGK